MLAGKFRAQLKDVEAPILSARARAESLSDGGLGPEMRELLDAVAEAAHAAEVLVRVAWNAVESLNDKAPVP